MKKAITKYAIIFALALVLVVVMFLGISCNAAAHARIATQTNVASGTTCEWHYSHTKFSLDSVWMYYSLNVCHNGSQVWATSVNCNPWSFGGTTNVQWCGVSHSGNYLEVGSNYSFVLYSNWLQTSGYSRIQYNTNGNVITYYGW